MVYFLLDNSNQIIFSSGLLYNGSVGEAALERYEFRWKFSHLSDERLLAERFSPIYFREQQNFITLPLLAEDVMCSNELL